VLLTNFGIIISQTKEGKHMGLMNWLMKGIGFEGEETPNQSEEALQEEKRKAKELKKQEKLARKLERQRAKNASMQKQFQDEEVQPEEPKSQISETSFEKEAEPNSGYSGYSDNNYQSQSYGGYDGQSYSQTSMNTYGNKNIVFFYPKSYSEVKQLIDYLKQGESVMLNLDGISDAEAQRMLDFSSGAVYAVNGSIKRVSGNIFLLTPEGLGIVTSRAN